MTGNLTIRIENTSPTKSLLPWVTIARRGRQSADTQCFALLGYPKSELDKLTPAQREDARDALEFAVRTFSAFEYIPDDPQEIESFFEKKLVNFENRLREPLSHTIPMQAAVGISQGNTMLFAISGDLSVLQIVPSRVVNLAASSARMTHDTTVLHFDSFQSGILSQRSCILVAPRIMAALFKSAELKNLALSGSSDSKLNYLETIWQKRNTNKESLRAILLDAKQKNARSTETTAVSIAHLIDTESKTEELLSPPLLKPVIRHAKSTSLKIVKALKLVAETYKTQKPNIKLKPKDSPPLIKTIRKRLKKFTVQKAKPKKPDRKEAVVEVEPEAEPTEHRVERKKYTPILSSKLHALASQLNTKLSLERYTNKLRSKLNSIARRISLVRHFNALPLKSKVLIFLACTFLFVFAQSVLLTMRYSRIAKVETKLKQEVQMITQIIDEANAALIYNDEEKTRLQMEEAEKRIQALPGFQKTAAEEAGLTTLRPLKFIATDAMISGLHEQITPLQEKLRHVVMVETQTLSDENQINALGFGQTPFTHAHYSDRLYTLEVSQNQILRHNKDGGFDQWLKDATDIRNGVSLAVDGSIYVLHDNSTVTKFLRGKRENFELKPIDPVLTHCTKIFTNDKSSYLYILEEKRLTAFNKQNGILKAQYQSPTFTELKDFVIDEASKTAYLLDGTSVVSIPLGDL